MKKLIVCFTMISILICGFSYVNASTGREKTPFEGIVIAEAGGSYENTKGTNSKQSIDESLKNGYKTIELDVSITSDERAVCINRWTKKTYDKLGFADFNRKTMTYDDFMSAKINGKYDTVNGKDIYNYVYKVSYDERGENKIPDARFILDFGNIKDKWDAFYSLRYLFVKDFKGYEDFTTLKIYNKTMYEGMRLLCELSNYMYVIDSKTDVKNIDNILEFCSDKNFMSIQIKNDFITKSIVDKCHKYGLQVVSTTTNSKKKAKKLLGLGVDCIATNTIKPDFGEK